MTQNIRYKLHLSTFHSLDFDTLVQVHISKNHYQTVNRHTIFINKICKTRNKKISVYYYIPHNIITSQTRGKKKKNAVFHKCDVSNNNKDYSDNIS